MFEYDRLRACPSALRCLAGMTAGVGQVFELERVRVLAVGKTEAEVVHGITSLGRGAADAGRLLGLNRCLSWVAWA